MTQEKRVSFLIFSFQPGRAGSVTASLASVFKGTRQLNSLVIQQGREGWAWQLCWTGTAQFNVLEALLKLDCPKCLASVYSEQMNDEVHGHLGRWNPAWDDLQQEAHPVQSIQPAKLSDTGQGLRVWSYKLSQVKTPTSPGMIPKLQSFPQPKRTWAPQKW